MKRSSLAALFMACLMPAAAMAQSSFDGTWKLDLGTIPLSTAPLIWLLQGGRYQCKSCLPPIDVKADGRDQPAARQQYDTISVRIVDHRTVEEIEKKNGQVVSDETFVVSTDGNTVTDEFATWKVTMARVAEGPPGSHLLSGSWRSLKIESVSDEGLLVTYKLEGGTLSMSRPTGQSYLARLDGTDAPYKGDPGTNGVSVRRIGAKTIEETDKLDGMAFSIALMTVSPDGKSMTIVVHDVRAGTTSQLTARKQ